MGGVVEWVEDCIPRMSRFVAHQIEAPVAAEPALASVRLDFVVLSPILTPLNNKNKLLPTSIPMRFCSWATYPGCNPGFRFWLYPHSSPKTPSTYAPLLDIPNFAQCEHIGFVPSQRIFFFRQGRHLQKHGTSIFRTRREQGNQ